MTIKKETQLIKKTITNTLKLRNKNKGEPLLSKNMKENLIDANQGNNSHKGCDWEVDKIMGNRTKACAFMRMRPITPLEEGLSSCLCMNT